MEKKVIDFLSKIEGYKTRIKEIHWIEPTISGHELAGEVESAVQGFEDSIAEDLQGVYGIDIDAKELNPVESKSTTLRKIIEEMIEETVSFYKTLDGDKFIGARSEVESFLHTLNVKKYLVRKTLRESISNKKPLLKEGKKVLNEKSLANLISEEITSMLY